MPTLSLGECSVDLVVEPLKGPLAASERQIAWRLYLSLIASPILRSDAFSAAELSALVDELRRSLADWPAAELETTRANQLGSVMLTVIDVALLPCLHEGPPSPATWKAVRSFCQALGRDLARLYRFHDVGAALPADWQAAWRRER